MEAHQHLLDEVICPRLPKNALLGRIFIEDLVEGEHLNIVLLARDPAQN